LKDESDRIAREIRDGLRPSKDNKIIKEMDKLIDDANLNISKADLSLYKKYLKQTLWNFKRFLH